MARRRSVGCPPAARSPTTIAWTATALRADDEDDRSGSQHESDGSPRAGNLRHSRYRHQRLRRKRGVERVHLHAAKSSDGPGEALTSAYSSVEQRVTDQQGQSFADR